MVFLQTYYFENYNVNTDYYVTLCALGFSLPASSAKALRHVFECLAICTSTMATSPLIFPNRPFDIDELIAGPTVPNFQTALLFPGRGIVTV
jgi:hypothetical protein